jgi:hypothetical protein
MDDGKSAVNVITENSNVLWLVVELHEHDIAWAHGLDRNGLQQDAARLQHASIACEPAVATKEVSFWAVANGSQQPELQTDAIDHPSAIGGDTF